MEGWVKVYRSIQEHWIWQDEKYLKWWLCILLNVNHDERKFPVGSEMHTCKPGQSFRSIEQWTDLFSCSKKTTLKFFLLLENDGMISRQILGSGNRRKHLLSVINWAEYQQTETENYTERVPKTTPREYPNIPPNKKDKNDKNKRYQFKDALVLIGVDEKIANDWIQVRKDKGASNTETAFNRIKREIDKSNKSANECIKIAVEKSWSGFEAKWIINELNSHSSNLIFDDNTTTEQIKKF